MTARASRCFAALALFCTSACGGASSSGGTMPRADRTGAPREVAIVVSPSLAQAAQQAAADPRRHRHIVEPAAITEPASARAAAGLDTARTMYRELRFEESLAAVSDAQMVLEANAAGPADFDALHQALLFRGMNELALGREERARDALRQAARLRPRATLDEGRVPPDARALYDEMRAAVRADPPAALGVTTVPAGARVLLDGEPAGAGPVSLNAAAGRHWLRVEAPGFQPRVLPVELSASGTPPLSVELPAVPEASHAARDVAALDEPGLRALSLDVRRALSRTLAADSFLRLRTLDDGDVEGLSLDLATGRVRRDVLPAASLSPDAARALSRFARRLTLPDERADPPPPPDEPTVFESPWLWVVVGAVAIGATTTAVVAAIYEPTPVFRVTALP